MSCQVFSGQNSVTLAGEARAIKYAADNGAVILQCSWGYNSSESSIINGYTPGPATEKEWAETYPLEKEALDTSSTMPVRLMVSSTVVFQSSQPVTSMLAILLSLVLTLSASAYLH